MIDKVLKQEYIEFIGLITPKKMVKENNKLIILKKTKIDIKLTTVNKSVEVLKANGLIFLKSKNRGYYIINPKYAFKGTETYRKTLIKSIIEKRLSNHLPIDMLLDVPVEEIIVRKDDIEEILVPVEENNISWDRLLNSKLK